MGLYDMLVIMQNEDKTKHFKQANEGVRCRFHRESSQLSEEIDFGGSLQYRED